MASVRRYISADLGHPHLARRRGPRYDVGVFLAHGLQAPAKSEREVDYLDQNVHQSLPVCEPSCPFGVSII